MTARLDDPYEARAAYRRAHAGRAARRRRILRRRLAIAIAALGILLPAVVTSGSSAQHHQGPPAGGASTTPSKPPKKPPIHPPSERSDALAIDRVLRHTSYVAVGQGHRRDVALTFDDGPDKFTPKIIATLRRYRTPATFFVIGRQAAQHLGLVRKEVQLGFTVGDHTQDHPYMGHLGPAAQGKEIEEAAHAIVDAGAPYPRLFRPPYGSFDDATLAQLKARRMLMVLWSVDTKDFARPGAGRIAYTAISGARPGAIILMHDGGGDRSQTLAALPRVIKALRRKHWHLVTVPQLVRDDPPLHNPPPRPLSGAEAAPAR